MEFGGKKYLINSLCESYCHLFKPPCGRMANSPGQCEIAQPIMHSHHTLFSTSNTLKLGIGGSLGRVLGAKGICFYPYKACFCLWWFHFKCVSFRVCLTCHRVGCVWWGGFSVGELMMRTNGSTVGKHWCAWSALCCSRAPLLRLLGGRELNNYFVNKT
jgi:hypothetical protein